MNVPAMSRADAQLLIDGVPLHDAVGLELADWGDGRVTFRFAPPPLCRDRVRGGVHGGAIVTALDTAACFAMIARTGQDCGTVDLRADFPRPALDAEFLVHGDVIRAGKRFGWAQATLEALDGRLVAAGRGTFVW
jgi:uncharacterized protein (TIGR00369 family)